MQNFCVKHTRIRHPVYSRETVGGTCRDCATMSARQSFPTLICSRSGKYVKALFGREGAFTTVST